MRKDVRVFCDLGHDLVLSTEYKFSPVCTNLIAPSSYIQAQIHSSQSERFLRFARDRL